jgi:hypothetical protein
MDNGLRRLLFPLLLTVFLQSPAFSQDLDQLSLMNENANSQMLREVREAFVNEHMEASLSAINTNRFDPAMADRNFISRVPQFRTAVERYRTSIGLEQTAKSLKDMDRLVDAFNTYFEQTHVDAPAADVTEFRDFSRKDLLWETLTTAERVDTKLRQAALLVYDARASNVTTVRSMVFLRNLHGELRRLDLLISKVK